MAERQLDKIHIRDLLLRCVLGVYEREREDRQDVQLNITLYADLKSACRKDSIEETVDYKAIKQQVMALVEGSSFRLVEGLAQAVADKCLEHPRVERVKVVVDKPGALRFARSAAVEIVRDRDETAQNG